MQTEQHNVRLGKDVTCVLTAK